MTSIPQIALDTLLKRHLPEVEEEVRVRQVLDLAKMTPFHAAGNVGNGILLAAIFWDRLPHWAIIIWLGLFALFSAFELPRWWRKRSWPAPKRVSRNAIRRTSFWAFYAGLMWAAALSYAFLHGDPVLQLLILFLVGGLAAGAVATMASQPIACAAYAGPPLIAVLILLATQGNTPVFHVMAAMGLLYLVVLAAALMSGFTSFVTIVRNAVETRSMEMRLLEMELAAAADANRAKSAFLAKMSHELRTPLNAIIGFSEIIREEVPNGGSHLREYAADIHDAGRHLLRIVDDVLDISRIEAGKIELRDGEIDLPLLVASVLKLIRPAAEKEGVKVSADLPLILPKLVGDEGRVRQIVLNLLSNAVKFSRQHGHASVGAAVRPDGALAIWVEDDGIGMTEAEVATAREPFRQAQNELSRSHDGTGLGLALVDAFVKLHGGTLEIMSARGAGTTVTALFPPQRVRWPERRPAAEAQPLRVRS
jgi:signal transduction histidine kinase